MKNSIFVLLLLSLSCAFTSDPFSESQKIANLKSFAKVYGYVKYFHPSDEASEIDWKKFAAYGSKKVLACQTREELTEALKIIFEPIAPGIQFSNQKNSRFDTSILRPSNPSEFDFSFWQHQGVSFDMNSGYQSPYQSVRVNGQIRKEAPTNYGLLINRLKENNLKNKRIRLSIWARLKDTNNTSAYLRLGLYHSDGTTTLDKETINSTKWKKYQLESEVGEQTDYIEVGTALKGDTYLFTDHAEFAYWDKNSWITIPLNNSSFEQEGIVKRSGDNNWYFRGEGYAADVTRLDSYEGQSAAVSFRDTLVKPEFGQKIFDSEPEFGEAIHEDIGNGLFCHIPIVLYSNSEGTFPKADPTDYKELQKALKALPNPISEVEIRLGNVINTYNVFQHFYPYMDVVSVDWDEELGKALSRSFDDTSIYDHYVTLEKFTAPLKDGHIYINHPGLDKVFAPRIYWEWIEGKLVITKVLDNQLPLNIGDEVTHVNGVTSEDYFKEVHSRISAGTPGWLHYKAKRKSLVGGFEEKMTVRVNGIDVILDRPGGLYGEGSRQSTHEKIKEDVYYLNLSTIEMATIDSLIPELTKSKAIICDLRGYPNRNHMFLTHLLKENDTSASWMRVPKIIYPNQDNIFGFENHGWFLQAKKPYLGDKQIIFITDGRAISYAESYMGFIEGYDLGTIIGQPTAGTNGNVNKFDLVGGFSIAWTGMKVVKHDGSQHHAIGIVPDIYLQKTINGVKEGKDEFLEKAIEMTKNQN